MKNNQPVIDEEVFLDEDTVIVSKTDLKGIITYVNDAFCRICGFSEGELLGRNHNIIRHPDMPEAAFENLWSEIHSGKPWTGLVKNRTKTGTYYWVQASVTPVYKNGRIVEYISVRRPANEQQKQSARERYDAINRGKRPVLPLLERFACRRRLDLTTKFLLAGGTALLLMLLLLGLLARQSLEKLDRAESELAGLKYIQPLRDLSQRLPEHRELINAYLNGDHSLQPEILDKQKQIDQALAAVRKMDERYTALLDIGSGVTGLAEGWRRIRQEVFQLQPEIAFARHTALISDLFTLTSELVKSSGLNRDSSLLQHYRANILLEKIPPVNEYLGQIRGLGVAVAARGEFAPGQLKRMTDLYNTVGELSRSLDDALKNLFRFDPQIKLRLAKLVDASDIQRQHFFAAIHDGLRKSAALEQDPGEFFAKGSRLIDTNFAILDEMDRFMAETLQLLADEARTGMNQLYLILAGSVMAALLVGLLMIMVIRGITRGLNAVRNQFRRIAEGYYYDNIDLERGDEIGGVLCDLKSMQIKLGYDVNEARQRAASSIRIKTALDNVSSSVMMVDNNASIIYLNKAAQQLFSDTEVDLQRDLPEFNATALLGVSIDRFHQYPQHQRALLENLKESFTTEVEIGGRALRLIANPVIDDAGERLGSAVEWSDRTAEVAVEKQVENLISAARKGDLGQRLTMDDKHGFHRNLSAGINELMDTLSQVFDEIASIVGRLSHGDLSCSINRDFKGMFSMVKDDINESLGILRDMVRKVRDASDQITRSSEEIFAGNNNLSLRTEEQASMLEETASSIEELTSTVKNNADNAQQANALALLACSSAEKGGEVVSQAVSAMKEIDASSEKISEIVSLIDGIAFQTNLLALNASVEAARAGEQGRGFAVVATEVRNLAGRSATAAREIKDLIQDSASKVVAGASLVNQSGKTLEEIVAGVRKVGTIISEIAIVSREQAAGIDQVNRAVIGMDEVTQHNAALAEQTCAASSAMKAKASQMDSLMGSFKLDSASTASGEEDDVESDLYRDRTVQISWQGTEATGEIGMDKVSNEWQT